MIQKIIQNTSWKWLDLTNPTQEELTEVAEAYGLHKASIYDCLDPEHLPKYESFQNADFLILRVYDTENGNEADTMKGLTHKIAFFIGENILITIHRVDLPFFNLIKTKWEDKSKKKVITADEVLHDIIRNSILTFRKSLNETFEKLAVLEEALFKGGNETSKFLEKIFFLKSKAFVLKRVLILTESVFDNTNFFSDTGHYLQDLKDETRKVYFMADELVDDINSLLNFHLSLLQNRTNDIIRTLTIITVFFIPLTFLVGLYGMNFKFMPELSWKWAYPSIWGLMLGISAGIFFWIRKKGWFH